MTKPTHYLRFVKAFILAAAVPACTNATTPSEPSPAKEEKPAQTEQTSQTEPKEEPAAATEEQHDAGADAELPFSSGPMMPPVFA